MISTKRLVPYGLVSSLLAAWTLVHAFSHRPNFYSAAVYLSGSSACVLILCNYGLFLSICAAKVLQNVLFGELRLIERERLHERLWYTVTESLLALTIFRQEFDMPFFVWFGGLLFVKIFHWLAMDRIESMQQAPRVTALFHARMLATLFILCNIYVALIFYTCEHILLRGPSVMAMFASEYIILYCSLGAMIWKYAIETLDRITLSDAEWETKSMWLFYGDLVFDFCKLVTYVSFFTFILTFYSLPLNLLRDVYLTTKSFLRKCVQLKRLKAATRDMESRYASATAQELEDMSDKTCIICREEMTPAQLPQAPEREEPQQGHPENRRGTAQSPAQRFVQLFKLRRVAVNETPKKLSCGHVFHFNCLKTWLERQQSCPTCRRPVLETNPTPARTQMGPQQDRQGRPFNAPAGPQQQEQQQQPAEVGQPALRHMMQGLREGGPPGGDLLRGALARTMQAQRPRTPPNFEASPRGERVASPLRRSERSARPSPSRTSSSTRLFQQAEAGTSSAGASPEPRHQALPENPFMRFTSQMPTDIFGYAVNQDDTGMTATSLPDGSTFTLPRVVAPGLGVPSSLILPSTSSRKAEKQPARHDSGDAGIQIRTGQVPTTHTAPGSPAFAPEAEPAEATSPRFGPSGSASAGLNPANFSLPVASKTISGPLSNAQSSGVPTTLPTDLSEEQLKTLGLLTREGLQERLNLLNSAKEGLEAWQTRLNAALEACNRADRPEDKGDVHDQTSHSGSTMPGFSQNDTQGSSTAP